MSANTYCVYMHTCLADGNCLGKVYIGITSRPPEKRWGSKGQYYKHCLYFDAAINKYGWDHFSHEVLASGLSKEEASFLEVRYIKEYRANNPKFGFNLTVGGDVLIGADNPTSIPVAVFDSESGNRLADFPCIADANRYCGASVWNCLNNKSKTVGSYICRFSSDVVGVDRLPPNQCFRHCSHPEKNKPVSQYDLSGNFIRDFNSIQEAEQALSLTRGIVGSAVRGVNKSGGGYLWRYSTGSSKPIDPWVPGAEVRRKKKSYRGKPIDQLDYESGVVIATFESTRHAERETGIRRSTIFQVIKGKPGKQSAGGFRWRYHPGGAQ